MMLGYLDIIKEMRMKKGMSQKEVAEQIGVSERKYWGFEKGNNGLTYEAMEKLEALFDFELCFNILPKRRL